jgi:hypothetical protein
MKWFFFRSLFVATFLYSCSEEKVKTSPDDYFSAGQKESLLKEIVRKTAKKPEGNISVAEREAYYQSKFRQYQWHFAHQSTKGFFFLVSRQAPSLHGKRVAIGGLFQSPDQMHILGFKEVFHTFKMKPNDLLRKSSVLFEKMVNDDDLSPYFPQNQKDEEEWIEFPDARSRYDSASQTWITQF